MMITKVIVIDDDYNDENNADSDDNDNFDNNNYEMITIHLQL